MRRTARTAVKTLVFIAAFTPVALLLARGLSLVPGGLGADPVRTVTDSTGITALRLLLITLCITPLRHLTHSAEWLRYRRPLGLFAFFYATLHVLMYMLIDRRLDMRILWEDMVKRPWITLGMGAFLLLVPLAMTSTRWAMARLKSRWQILHRCIYLITLLVCWHFYWQVKRDVREPLAYAAVFLMLMALRLWRSYTRRATVS